MFCNTHFSCTPLMHLLTDWIFWLLNLVLNFTYFYPHYTYIGSQQYVETLFLTRQIIMSHFESKYLWRNCMPVSVQVIQEVHNWVCYLYNWLERQHMKTSSIMPAVHSSVLGQPMSLIGRIIWQDAWYDVVVWQDDMMCVWQYICIKIWRIEIVKSW